MRSRQRVTVRSTLAPDDPGTVFVAVTEIDVQQGALIVNYDGRDGPEQTIFAPNAWMKVATAMEPPGDG